MGVLDTPLPASSGGGAVGAPARPKRPHRHPRPISSPSAPADAAPEAAPAWLLAAEADVGRGPLAARAAEAAEAPAVATSAAQAEAQRKIAGLKARVAAIVGDVAAPAAPPLPKPAQELEAVALGTWPDAVRAVPNDFLRTALFAAIAKGRRRRLEDSLISSTAGFEVRFSGMQLDQDDLDVWLAVLHAARLQAMGTACRVSSYALLQIMAKTDTGPNRKALKASINRLVDGTVTLRHEYRSWRGHLIASAAHDAAAGAWVIVIDPKARWLFSSDQYTLIAWAARRRLDGYQLAQWLHGYYSSHAKPLPVRVETLHELSGSQAVLMTDFAKTLRRALGMVFRQYTITKGLVQVTTIPSGAQKRHLDRRAKVKADAIGKRGRGRDGSNLATTAAAEGAMPSQRPRDAVAATP